MAVADLVSELPGIQTRGFLDDFRDAGTLVGGLEVLGKYSSAKSYSPDMEFIICLGHIGRDTRRRDLFMSLAPQNLGFLKVVSPRALQSVSAEVGEGTVVFPGAVLGAETKIGDHCIINSGAIVEHHASVGDFSHVAPGAIVLGGASIGRDVFVGAGAIVFQGITVSPGCVVPAGSVVKEDI